MSPICEYKCMFLHYSDFTNFPLPRILVTVAMVRDRDFSSRINQFVSYSGFTPLHYAVVLEDHSMVKYLLEKGIYLSVHVVCTCHMKVHVHVYAYVYVCM